jgi:hypothetical protein
MSGTLEDKMCICISTLDGNEPEINPEPMTRDELTTLFATLAYACTSIQDISRSVRRCKTYLILNHPDFPANLDFLVQEKAPE